MNRGKLIIIGAGPGDPELLTLKGARHLQSADIILTDRLASPQILEEFANPLAQVIYVGKQCRKKNSTPQASINELIVYYCLLGKNVVRLKGGDVSIFSNITDELEAAVANGIAFEIVPGVTAALGAAAYAGIPLTARGHATSVRFLTLYRADLLSGEYWKELAHTDDTLVFYMSADTLEHVVRHLTENNIDEEKMLAIVEQATTPFQKVFTGSLYDYHLQFANRTFESPSLVIIGRVVNLHDQFKWIANSREDENYFPLPSENLSKAYHSEKLLKHAS